MSCILLESGDELLLEDGANCLAVEGVGAGSGFAVAAELVDLSDLSTPTGTLAATLGRDFMENANETGAFTITFANDDPDLLAVLTPNTLVNFTVYGQPAFTGVFEQATTVYSSQGEDHDLTTVWEGSGILALFDRATVNPALSLLSRPVEEDRGANWEAAIYDWPAHGAVAATAVDTVANAQAGSFGAGNWDADFAAPGADIIGPTGGTPTSAPVGDWYPHQTATLATGGNFQIQVLCSTFADVSFDGAHLMSPGADSDTFPWLKMTTANIELTAGLHTIAARVANFGGGTGFAFAIVEVNDDGSLGSVAGASGAAFAEVIDYPGETPGMTPGELFLMFLGEAQAGTALGPGRALGDTLAFVNLVNCTFDETLDTNGDPWSQLADYGTKVGTTLLQVLRELTTYVDFWFTPGTLDFNMVIKGARGSVSGVDLHRPTAGPSTGNIIEWSARTEGTKTNTVLVRSNVGWSDRTAAGSISSVGRIEAAVSYGAASSLEEVNRMADADLDDFARERTQHTIEIMPAGGDIPYTDFFVADTVTLEGEDHVVLGLGAKEDSGMERPQFPLVLNDGVVLDPMERVAQWLTKEVPMTIGGRSQRAQPFVPAYQPRKVVPPIPVVADPLWYAVAQRTASSGSVSRGLFNDAAFPQTFTSLGGTNLAPTYSDGQRVGLQKPPDSYSVPATYDYWGTSRGLLRIDPVTSVDHYVEATVDGIGTVGATDVADVFQTWSINLWGRMDRGEATEDLDSFLNSGYVASFGRNDSATFGVLAVQLDGSALFAGPSNRAFEYNDLSGVSPLGAPLAPGDVIRMEISGTGDSTVIELKINGSTIYTWNGPPDYWSGTALDDPDRDLPNTGMNVGFEMFARTPDKTGASVGMEWTDALDDVVALVDFTAGNL